MTEPHPCHACGRTDEPLDPFSKRCVECLAKTTMKKYFGTKSEVVTTLCHRIREWAKAGDSEQATKDDLVDLWGVLDEEIEAFVQQMPREPAGAPLRRVSRRSLPRAAGRTT